MNYRRLGRSGLQVSELSIGSWVTYGNQVDHRAARESLRGRARRGRQLFPTTPRSTPAANPKRSWVRRSRNWHGRA